MPEAIDADKEQTRWDCALDGLKKLAYGPVNDAVRLIANIRELTPGDISRLDLFPVSEIRQNKEGCLEIKFYDRLKAFELLITHSGNPENQPAASSFYGALESAAKSARDVDAL